MQECNSVKSMCSPTKRGEMMRCAFSRDPARISRFPPHCQDYHQRSSPISRPTLHMVTSLLLLIQLCPPIQAFLAAECSCAQVPCHTAPPPTSLYLGDAAAPPGTKLRRHTVGKTVSASKATPIEISWPTSVPP